MTVEECVETKYTPVTFRSKHGNVYTQLGSIGEDIQVSFRVWSMQWGNGYNGIPSVFGWRVRLNLFPPDPRDFLKVMAEKRVSFDPLVSVYKNHASFSGTIVVQEPQGRCNVFAAAEELDIPMKLQKLIHDQVDNLIMDMESDAWSALFIALMAGELPRPSPENLLPSGGVFRAVSEPIPYHDRYAYLFPPLIGISLAVLIWFAFN